MVYEASVRIANREHCLLRVAFRFEIEEKGRGGFAFLRPLTLGTNLRTLCLMKCDALQLLLNCTELSKSSTIARVKK